MTQPAYYTGCNRLFSDDERADRDYDEWYITCADRATFRLWWRPGVSKALFCFQCPKLCEEGERR